MTNPKILDLDEYEPMIRTVYGDVHLERVRAHHKHDSTGGSMERKTYDDPAWLPVLVEKVGEVARELCDVNQFNPVVHMGRLRGELVQVAAMTMAWIEAIDREGRFE